MFMRYVGNGIGHQKVNPGSAVQSLKVSDLHDDTMDIPNDEHTGSTIFDNTCQSEHESETDSEDEEELRMEEQDGDADEELEYENNWSTL